MLGVVHQDKPHNPTTLGATMSNIYVVSVVIPDGDIDTVKPILTMVAPDGTVKRSVTAYVHDWACDRLEDTCVRSIRHLFGETGGCHGYRQVYQSPSQSEATNPGYLTVFEFDFDS